MTPQRDATLAVVPGSPFEKALSETKAKAGRRGVRLLLGAVQASPKNKKRARIRRRFEKLAREKGIIE